MQELGVVSKVTEPTEWCVGMVVVPKPNGQVRICVDLTRLNQSVLGRDTLPEQDSGRSLCVLQVRPTQQLQEAGVTLNNNKCPFSQSSVTFLGHLLGGEGIRPDPEKVATLRNFHTQQSMGDVRFPTSSAKTGHGCGEMLRDEPSSRSKV
jgi:hypothetical protein